MSDRYYPTGMTATSQAYETIIDKWMSALTGGQWKALMYFCRRTVGFGKEEDAVSLSQLCCGITNRNGRQLDGGTGLTREAALAAVRELETTGLLIRTVRPNPLPALYRINWTVATQESQKPTGRKSRPVASRKSRPELVGKADPQETVQPADLQPRAARDIDSPPMNRKQRDSSAGVPAGVDLPESACKKYPRLKAALRRYMDAESDEPTDRLVIEVMNAADGGSEDAVVACLHYLYTDRGLKPGTKNGPRLWSWFPTVVQDYFQRKGARAEAAQPCGYWEWEDRQKFDDMTSVLELPDAGKGAA